MISFRETDEEYAEILHYLCTFCELKFFQNKKLILKNP